LSVNEQSVITKLDNKTSSLLEQVLLEYFQLENDDSLLTNACMSTGLTLSLAKTISKNYYQYDKVESVQSLHSYISDCVAENICSLVQQVLDMDTE
jgi:hypothetical protein